MGRFLDKLLQPRAANSYSSLSIVFPAYIYPSSWQTPAAWDPLYDAIASKPYIFFHIVINPNSGPGGLPNSDYQKAIKKLRTYSNVYLLGYVHTSWATRSLSDVYSDIDTYKQWDGQGFGLNGVFFDETPTAGTDAPLAYMKNVTVYARAQLKKRGVVTYMYFNPGTIPDVQYYNIADRVVAFEDTYANFLNQQQNYRTGTKIDMKKTSFLINSVNSGVSQSQYNDLVASLANNGNLSSLYLTSVTDQSNPYGAFGTDWTTFVNAVDNLRIQQ